MLMNFVFEWHIFNVKINFAKQLNNAQRTMLLANGHSEPLISIHALNMFV